MSDSWSRYPSGLLVGTTHQMGVYEECIKVHQPIKGKYCVPSVKISSSTVTDFVSDQPHENSHAWHEILGVSIGYVLRAIMITLILNIIIVVIRDKRSGIWDITLYVCPKITLRLGIVILILLTSICFC